MALSVHSPSSNNTNKLSPQELSAMPISPSISSNNTNKLSPQEPIVTTSTFEYVQIIQINLALKNSTSKSLNSDSVQIIQINLALKNSGGD